MRTPEVERALNAVEKAARAAVTAGASPQAVTWTATAYATTDDASWPTDENRARAAAAVQAYAPPGTWIMRITDDGPKMLRETLCLAQAAIIAVSQAPQHHLDSLQRLIAECDRHRPLGPDGKHGNRHTPTCGCDR